MKPSLQCFSFFLVLSFLASCAGEGFKLNCDSDEVALQEATEKGDIKEMQRLLAKKNVNPNATCNKHFMALYKAVDEENPEAVKLLLDHGADPNAVDDEDQPTPLLNHAVLGSNLEKSIKIAQLLLDHGANINSQDFTGDTPLHNATHPRFGGTIMATFLIERGADPSIENNSKHKAYYFKRRASLDAMSVSSRLSLSDFEANFILAATAGDRAKVDLLLDNHEVDINKKDRNGDTALIKAARSGHTTLAEELIERGANLNLKNNEGQTALMVAIEAGHEAVALALIPERKKDKINLDLKDNKGWSALKYARKGKGKNKQIENALLDNGAKEYSTAKQIKNGLKRAIPGAARRTIEIAPEIAPLLL